MRYILTSCVLVILFLLSSCGGSEKSSEIRLNDIQVIGSHNSYKIKIQDELLDLLRQRDSSIAASLEYEHRTLKHQLDLGLRNLEIDLFYDPDGGYYSQPIGQQLLRSNGIDPLEFDEEGTLSQPGLKVFHVQDIDFRSHDLLFKDNLMVIKEWSKANPNHVPVIVLMNAKDQEIDELTVPKKFDKVALESIDEEIKGVFDLDMIITPDMVRGSYTTLEKAVLDKGWPSLEKVRGKVLFFLDVGEEKMDLYQKDHPSLRGRVMFINRKEGAPEAAFRLLNDPVHNLNYIKELVGKGYMVRTRADADTYEARKNDYSRFEKAKESGAQVITTDYYEPSGLFDSEYVIRFDDNSYERIK